MSAKKMSADCFLYIKHKLYAIMRSAILRIADSYLTSKYKSAILRIADSYLTSKYK